MIRRAFNVLRQIARNLNAAPNDPSKTVYPLRFALRDSAIIYKQICIDSWKDHKKSWFNTKKYYKAFGKHLTAENARIRSKTTLPGTSE